MTKRKGGIGRRPGKKKCCSQKKRPVTYTTVASRNTVTKEKALLVRELKALLIPDKLNRKQLLNVKVLLSKGEEMISSKNKISKSKHSVEIRKLKTLQSNELGRLKTAHRKELQLVNDNAQEKIKQVLDDTSTQRIISRQLHKEATESIKSVKQQIADIKKRVLQI